MRPRLVKSTAIQFSFCCCSLLTGITLSIGRKSAKADSLPVYNFLKVLVLGNALFTEFDFCIFQLYECAK